MGREIAVANTLYVLKYFLYYLVVILLLKNLKYLKKKHLLSIFELLE